MLATHGPNWYGRQQPDSGWSSFVISVGLTFALFAAAFLAMRTVPAWINSAETDRDRPVVVRLDPPAAPTPAPKVEIQPRTEPVVRPMPSVAPAVPAQPAAIPAAPPLVTAPLVASPALPSPERATSLAPAAGIPIGIARDTLRGRGNQPVMGIRGGAPVAPSGLTIGDRVKNTPAYRDSMAKSVLANIPELARTRPPTGQEKAELEQSQRQARLLARRQTTAGSSEVVVMQGQGRGGEGAVGGGGDGVKVSTGPASVMVSIPFPLFSPGPSPEQRKRNEALERDYNSRLGRLNDRLLIIRDSIRADSLRRDSVAKLRKP